MIPKIVKSAIRAGTTGGVQSWDRRRGIGPRRHSLGTRRIAPRRSVPRAFARRHLDRGLQCIGIPTCGPVRGGCPATGDGGLAGEGERARGCLRANGMQQSTSPSIFRTAGVREVCNGSPAAVLPSPEVLPKSMQLATKMAPECQISLSRPRRRVGSILLDVGCPWIAAEASETEWIRRYPPYGRPLSHKIAVKSAIATLKIGRPDRPAAQISHIDSRIDAAARELSNGGLGGV